MHQVQTISEEEQDLRNICMLGVFAPWGRGKTYFFNKVKKEFDNLNGAFEVVEFNAWKYQETPAIWAHLYETLDRELNSKWYDISIYKCYRFICDILTELKSNALGWIIGVSITLVLYKVEIKSIVDFFVNEKLKLIFVAPIGLVAVVKYFLSSYKTFKALIKYTRKKTFANHLGLQNEIEYEIERLLEFHVNKHYGPNKIVLYVDDIDRCPHEKMVQIIDYFRTVLEREEIRKRLIVVCSVDPAKLKSALKNKYQSLYYSTDAEINRNELDKMITEQFDKLFFSRLGLPALNLNQQIEYLVSLTNAHERFGNSYESDNTLNIVHSGISLDEVVGGEGPGHIEEVTDSILFHKILDVIKTTNDEFTPRKLRIIHNRILLANNIISLGATGRVYDNDLLVSIVNRSIDSKYKVDDKYKQILEMVVPY